MEINNKYNIGDKFYRYDIDEKEVDELEIYEINSSILDGRCILHYCLTTHYGTRYREVLVEERLDALARTPEQCIKETMEDLRVALANLKQ